MPNVQAASPEGVNASDGTTQGTHAHSPRTPLSDASRYPRATIVGLDLPDALAIARDNINAAGVTNITLVAGGTLDLRAAADRVPVLKGSGTDSPGKDAGELLRNGGFDLAHTHQVMFHVQDPVRFTRELQWRRQAARGRGLC